MPGGPRAMSFSRGDGTLPVLDLDGERIVDSTAIIAALEQRQPEPAIYPADAAQRRRALELEDFFDESAGHDMRRVGFWEARQNLGYAVAFMTTDQPRARRSVGRVGLRVAFPGVWRYMSSRYAFDEEAVKRSRTTIVEALDRIEAERAGGDHLVGDGFTVADLTAAALLYPLVWPPEYQYELPGPTQLAVPRAVPGPSGAWLDQRDLAAPPRHLLSGELKPGLGPLRVRAQGPVQVQAKRCPSRP